MKLNYRSKHTNSSPKDIVESLKCMQGMTEHLNERADETQKISILRRHVPAYYQAIGVKKSGELNFLAAVCG